MTDNAVMLEDEYLAAAKEYLNILAQEKELAEHKAACKAILEKVLAVGEQGISPNGEPLVAVRQGAARFDPDLAARNLPDSVLASITVSVPDAKRAKAILAPALLSLCVVHNRPSIVAL